MNRSTVGVILGAAAMLAGCAPQSQDEAVGGAREALSGREGKIDFELDAPWRLEPVEIRGVSDYGPIPIQITIDDAHLLDRDGDYHWIGNFEGLDIVEKHPGYHYTHTVDFDDLAEVEAEGGPWRYTGLDDAYERARPVHVVCEPWRSSGCESARNVGDTAKWYALAWYVPQGDYEPGDDVRLELTVRLNARRNSLAAIGELELRTHVVVHLGENPLPRFGSSWLYGDLHYHSQTTDNEGESGHNFRGTVRAMGAIGLDFAFATDHASYSRQLVDMDGDILHNDVGLYFEDLRDLSPERFRFAIERINDPVDGANAMAVDNLGGVLPSQVRSRGIAPRLFMGAEVDALPEIESSDVPWGIPFGNGRRHHLSRVPDLPGIDDLLFGKDLGDPWTWALPSGHGTYYAMDWQGLGIASGRQHILHLPSTADPEAFVPSRTSTWGGGTQRLEDQVTRMAASGAAFIAHPFITEGSDMPGPTVVPLSGLQMSSILRQRAVLGLQLWNENPRLGTEMGEGVAVNTGAFGYTDPHGTGECTDTGCLLEVQPFETQFPAWGWGHSSTPTYGATIPGFTPEPPHRGPWSTLHHSLHSYDAMLLAGMRPSVREEIPWLDPSQPRRLFVAGGSDAHGDFNYRREGYMVGTTAVNSTAIGSPRNLVDVVSMGPGGTAGIGGVSIGSRDTGDPSGGTAPAVGAALLDDAPRMARRVGGEEPEGRGSASVERRRRAPSERGSLPFHGDHEHATFDGTTRPGITLPRDFDQSQIVGSLRAGRFAVTDGPALRIVIDRNRNGEIDAKDEPMGGIARLYGEDTIPLLIEWRSTPEFGPVNQVDLYVGAANGNFGVTYAPPLHGVRDDVDPQQARDGGFVAEDGQTRWKMEDGYYEDPTEGGILRHLVHAEANPDAGYRGIHRVTIDPAQFQTHGSVYDTDYYVRAFARTIPADPGACRGSQAEVYHRQGKCLERLAFTNPIWAVRPTGWDGGECPIDPKGIDGDGDRLPDGCDPCPDVAGECDPAAPVIEWAKRLGASGIDDAQAVTHDRWGNVYVAGMLSGSATMNGERDTFHSDGSAPDGWVAKIDRSGNLVWLKQLRGSGNIRVHDLEVDDNGFVTVVGWFVGELIVEYDEIFVGSSDDMFVLSLYGPAAGPGEPPVRWARTFVGAGRDVVTSVAIGPDGDPYVAGYFQNDLLLWGKSSGDVFGPKSSAGGYDCIAIRFDDLTGRVMRSRQVHGAGDCFAEGVAVEDDGDVLVAGRYDGTAVFDWGVSGGTRTSSVDYNAFLAKYAADAMYPEWNVTFGDGVPGCTNGDARITDVGTSGGGGMVVGHFRRCAGVRAESSTHVIGNVSDANFEGFVARVSDTGTFVDRGHKGLGPYATGNVRATAIDVERDGTYAVGGYFDGYVMFPGAGSPLWGGGSSDGYVAIYDPWDALLWADTLGGGAADSVSGVSLTAGAVAMAGRFTGTVEPVGGLSLASAGNIDACVAQREW